MGASHRSDTTPPHPYLSGNFAPIRRARALTPCSYEGTIPLELAGGQYVRNGGNPQTNEDLGRDAHWFDGDGMLSGVLFRKTKHGVQPEFVNQYLLTDVYLNASARPNLKRPILPSITTMLHPLNSIFTIILAILRTVMFVILSHLPGSRQAIKKISVANTGVLFHDGRALATCESGPPLRFLLPSLETVGWFNGRKAENEPIQDSRSGLGGDGPLAFMKEWTTGHPRVDPITKELISFHSVFVKPFVYYSIVPATNNLRGKGPLMEPLAEFDIPVPGVDSPKMMHDFGVSLKHTVIMDLPLSLDPMNIARGKPVVCYDPLGKSRFGVFPRYEPSKIQWLETNPCVIFHVANCWDSDVTHSSNALSSDTHVDMLVCRLTSASLVYNAGAIAAPVPEKAIPAELMEDEQCRLYYYNFQILPRQQNILHQWALSAISFEFPTLAASQTMKEARFIYGCSTGDASYTAALGKAVKIDYLAKIDAGTLIERGKLNPPQQIKGCVDERTISEVLQSHDPHDPIQLFAMPPGHFAQEPRFVPRIGGTTEDDGWLLTYVFDEAQLDARGECSEDVTSELWVIDAKTMKDVVAKIHLPQRVPYGLHGAWFDEEEILHQRVCLGFGSAPTRDAIFTVRPWHFTNPYERKQQTESLIEANSGDKLVLHMELEDFDWKGADSLLVVISESVNKKPVYVILGKNEASDPHVAVSGYQCFTDEGMSSSVQFKFATLVPNDTGIADNFTQWRSVGYFEVAMYRLKNATGTQDGRVSRTLKEFVNLVRFGMPKDGPWPPVRFSKAADLKIRRVRIEMPHKSEDNDRYYLCDTPRGAIHYKFHYRSTDWVKACERNQVEEYHNGIISKRKTGLFANAETAAPTSQQVNPQVSFTKYPVAATGIANDDVICMSEGQSNRPKRPHPGIGHNAPNAIEVDLDSPSKRLRPNQPSHYSEQITAGNSDIGEDLVETRHSRAISVESESSVIMLSENKAHGSTIRDVSQAAARERVAGIPQGHGSTVMAADEVVGPPSSQLGDGPNVIRFAQIEEAIENSPEPASLVHNDKKAIIEEDTILPSVERDDHSDIYTHPDGYLVGPCSGLDTNELMNPGGSIKSDEDTTVDQDHSKQLPSSAIPLGHPRTQPNAHITQGYTNRALSLSARLEDVRTFQQVFRNVQPVHVEEDQIDDSSSSRGTPAVGHALVRENNERRREYDARLGEMETELYTSFLDLTERMIDSARSEVDQLYLSPLFERRL